MPLQCMLDSCKFGTHTAHSLNAANLRYLYANTTSLDSYVVRVAMVPYPTRARAYTLRAFTAYMIYVPGVGQGVTWLLTWQVFHVPTDNKTLPSITESAAMSSLPKYTQGSDSTQDYRRAQTNFMHGPSE